MHLLPLSAGTLDPAPAAVDLAQTPADVVVLSFSDGDLAGLAAAVEGVDGLPSLRLAALKGLGHPFSVDLYVDKVAARARLVIVRALGGLDYWRYGLEELGAAARRHGFHLAAVPGCEQLDPRLDALSTLPEADLRRLWLFFREGGPANLREAMRFAASRIGQPAAWREPEALPAGTVVPELCRMGASSATAALLPCGEKVSAQRTDEGSMDRPEPLIRLGSAETPSPPRGEGRAPHALLTFYRSALLAGDVAPVAALADALHARGARVTAFAASSLKDAEAADALAALIAADPPDVVLNTTAFSARRGEGATVLDRADAPVLQVVQAASGREAWAASDRGLRAADLAMNVVLPEVDGRLLAGAISFKEPGPIDAAREFSPVLHRPDPERVAHAADLALAWARLRRAPRAGRRLALVLSDYPGKAGRGGYAVGLDAPASLAGIAASLAHAGYAVEPVADSAALMARLTAGEPLPVLGLDAYARAFAQLPAGFRDAVLSRWGDPADDPDAREGAFAFRHARLGAMVCAVQPDRGTAADRRADYHDAALPPRHGYVAFYLWLREAERIHALVHLGTHGTLEWLPGKAVALSSACAPEAVLGPVPLIYPFIVSDPGEAAQAKRRVGAVTVGHLTPPLVAAGTHGATAELEALFDEYAEAQGLDARRARLLGQAILDRARDADLLADCGVPEGAAPEDALARLDAWLCDVKEARIGDGLHVFGAAASGRGGAFDACSAAETAGLLAALDGRFVPPGPSGSPAAGRADVLPTGRNLFAVDPRAVPTRTAWEIGTRAAAEFATRYAQDHGDWPRRLVMDLWGSATMRTGGDDLAQALALMGVRPRWHAGSTRVDGFEVLPAARLERPRVDVTLRISGLFRDTFPEQIALFDAAARAVAALDEDGDWNPLAAARRAGGGLDRVFGGAPDAYGLGLARAVSAGAYASRGELGERYIAGTSHAYAGADAAARPSPGFRERVAGADSYLHVADLPEVDVLSSDTFAEHEGGFAAAAASLGARPALYHADATVPGTFKVRTLSEEVARAVRARATNPRWIAGQMRHGHRGAAEIAETVDALFCFAATSDAAPSRHFDLLFDATLGDDAVRGFMVEANPAAARAVAERFAEAQERGYWHARRNSTAALLAELRAAA
ncbi:cobaltochelatase subunit CobN [Lichenibacterium dinghuense]|uniref:cobaltochelatase subunit CobN n=1 Tax=Lichenibacterium dinghuense TaxID=2895977 RepID=UPI001F482502|nr:cobaltochelatase subunit CobN [Lichenibacterium sp. 6Y81]